MRAGLLPGLVAGFLAGPLGAQSSEQRRQIEALRDTLELVTDTMALREREAFLLRGAPRSSEDPFYHLYLGTLALRQGELGGAGHFDEAAAEFRWAARLAPQWSSAWYGAGIAELRLGTRLGTGSRDPRRIHLAREAWSRGAEALARAVSLEPGLADRLEPLAIRALREATPELAAALRDALEPSPARSPPPRVRLAFARLQRLLGDTGALRSFGDYLAGGENRALALLELGRTQLLLGDLGGMTRYLAAAAETDSAAAAGIRADLAWIATESELAEFDRRQGPDRVEFLRRFWIGRDRLELRPDGERLAEHLRRLAVARRQYLIGRAEEDRLDDRGRIYLRHGDPDERVRLAVPGIVPNESWAYRRGDRTLVLHFVARQAPGAFRLVESLQDMADARSGGPGSRLDESLYRSRSPLDPLYREAPLGPAEVARYLARERDLGRRGIREATTTDSYPVTFPHPLNGWARVVAAGATGAHSTIQIVFSLLPSPGDPETEAARTRFPLRLRFVALDSLANVVASLDSLLDPAAAAPAGPPGPEEGRSGSVAIPVRPGQLLAHAMLQYGPDAGSEFGVDSVSVPSPGAGQLALGDLVIGSPRGIPLRLGDGTVFRIADRSVVYRRDGIELAADVFGLMPNLPTTLQVLVAPEAGDEGRGGDRLRWRVYPDPRAVATVRRRPHAGPVLSWRVSLGLRNLPAGRWRIALVATRGFGAGVRREAQVEVRDP
jgi:GWxTD domain-containing protein